MRKILSILMFGLATLATFSNKSEADDTSQNSKHKYVSKELKYAILLIDADYTLEDAYHPEKNPEGLWDLEKEIQNMGEVLQAANTQGLPIFEIIMARDGICRSRYWVDEHNNVHKARHKDTSSVYSLEPVPCESNPFLRQYWGNNWVHVEKEDRDSFTGTVLRRELESRGITDLIVMGHSQIDCVRKTIETAVQFGYIVHTSFDVMQSSGGSEDDEIYNKYCKDERYNKSTGCTFLNEVKQFYRTKTELVSTYKDLPIFINSL